MELGVADHIWTIGELVVEALKGDCTEAGTPQTNHHDQVRLPAVQAPHWSA
jgi:hypothetical protein